MKKIISLSLAAAVMLMLSSCGEITTNSQSAPPASASASQPVSGTDSPASPAQGSNGGGNPVTVSMADGSKKTVMPVNGCYQFETGSPIIVRELAYLHNNPSVDMAMLKLIFEGDAPMAIAFLVPKHIVHNDYQKAWENADSILNIEDFNADGLYGADTSWQMPFDFWNYEVRVFDDRQADTKTELAFVPLALEGEIKIGELIQLENTAALKVNALMMDQTEYKVGSSEEITGLLDAEGFGEEAWVGTVPSGVPHGDDERNDTYDESFDYLQTLENGKFSLELPETAGHYDLRICDGTVEVAYMTFVMK